MDIDQEDPLLPPLMGNGPVNLPPRLAQTGQQGNHISAPVSQQESDNESSLNQMFVLQEALKHGLASTRQQLRKTSEALDGMRRSVCVPFD